MKPRGVKEVDAIEGHYVKGSKPGSERQRSHIFSHMWEIDTYK
jgi:hypothetical protein